MQLLQSWLVMIYNNKAISASLKNSVSVIIVLLIHSPHMQNQYLGAVQSYGEQVFYIYWPISIQHCI